MRKGSLQLLGLPMRCSSALSTRTRITPLVGQYYLSWRDKGDTPEELDEGIVELFAFDRERHRRDPL